MKYVLCAALLTTSAHAGEPRRLQAGESAPFDGMLYEPGHAASLLRADATAARARAELRLAKAKLLRTEGSLLAERQARQAELEAWSQRESAFSAALVTAEKAALDAAGSRPEPFFESPLFWGLVGIGAGALLGYGLGQL